MPGANSCAARERRGQHQHVLHPLPRPHGLQHAAGDTDRACAGTVVCSAGTSVLVIGVPLRPGDGAGRTTRGDRGPERGAGQHVARVVHAEHQPGQRHRRHQHGHQRAAAAARRTARAAAVVEVACADGKLSRLGVPTSTCTRGSSGRGRRTTRFTPIEAPWASATAAVAVIQSRRRRRSASAPSAPSASQPPACSPNSDIARAARTTGGRADAALHGFQRAQLGGVAGRAVRSRVSATVRESLQGSGSGDSPAADR